MNETKWKIIVAIIIFLIILFVIEINSSPVRFNKERQEFEYNPPGQRW